MKIEIYEEIKKAIKDALTEWHNENKKEVVEIQKKEHTGESLLTVKQFCKKYIFISENGLRHKLFFKDHNTFNKCFVKAGRKILIKEKEAIEWFSNPPLEADWTYDKKKWGPK
jgi:hypothetical protein